MTMLETYFKGIFEDFLEFYDQKSNGPKPLLYLLFTFQAIPYFILTVAIISPYTIMKEFIVNFNLTYVNIFVLIFDTYSDVLLIV